MNIVMLEPLQIPNELLSVLTGPLNKAGHVVVPCHKPLSLTEKKERIREADILLIANSPLTGEILQEARQLKYISVAFTGTDHVDKAVCAEKGIKLSNASGYATKDVAELTVAMMIALLRDVKAADARLRAGGTKAGLVAHRLQGKTVGILGTGAIGLQVARLLTAFGCRVIATSRSLRQEAQEMGISYVSLDQLLAQSDILSLHTPLTEQTRHFLNRERIAQMKRGAFLVNCARGPVVDSAALAEALHSGHLSGAALDVFDVEPPVPQEDPLLSAPNTLLTPHIAYFTEESMEDRAAIAFDNITKYLAGDWVRQVPIT